MLQKRSLLKLVKAIQEIDKVLWENMSILEKETITDSRQKLIEVIHRNDYEITTDYRLTKKESSDEN